MNFFEPPELVGQSARPPFNPPSCPAVRVGEPVDISNVPIYPYIEEARVYYGGQVPPGAGSVLWFAFGRRSPEGDLPNYAETQALTVGVGSPLAAIVHELEANPHDPRLERIRAAVVARTVRCPGAVQGECWALGKEAVEEVLTGVLALPPEA